MKLVVGLGNPGRKYIKTRHNIGFVAVEQLVEKFRDSGAVVQSDWKESRSGKLLYIWVGSEVEIIKPQTFVNNSGESVDAVKRKHQNLKTSDIFVIHDDLDIKLGEFKIQKGKGPRDHNGLLSIYNKLGTKDFWHVRVGIENRGADQITGEEYVLREFLFEEQDVIRKVIDSVVYKLKNSLNLN